MLTDDEYVLEDPDVVIAPPAGAIVDLTARLPMPEPEPFEIDVPLEDDVPVHSPAAEMDWATFVTTVHDGGYGDAEMRVLLALAVLTKGAKGENVEIEELAERAGRRPATVTPMLPRLISDGWLVAYASLSDKGRPVKRYRSARSIG